MASIDEHRRRVMLVRACVGTTIEAELYLLAQARHVYKWVRARFQSADFCVGRLCVMYIYVYLPMVVGVANVSTVALDQELVRGPRN